MQTLDRLKKQPVSLNPETHKYTFEPTKAKMKLSVTGVLWALKPQAEKLITLGKKDSLHTTKLLVSQLQDIQTANKVKKTLSKRYEKRNGGYTRIIKAGFRYGDNAPMAIIEFVDRDVEAKRINKKKKEASKETPKAEEKKVKSA